MEDNVKIVLLLSTLLISSYSYSANTWYKSIAFSQVNKMKLSCINNKKALDCFTAGIYEKEIGNLNEAMRLLELSCKYENNEDFCTEYGVELADSGKIHKGLNLLSSKCLVNNPRACFYTGAVLRDLYELQTGEAVKSKIKKQGQASFKKACGLGHDWSCKRLVKW